MKIGVFPKLSNEVSMGLALRGEEHKAVHKYLFDAVGREIGFGEGKPIGRIEEARIVTKGGARRIYVIVGVYYDMEERTRQMMADQPAEDDGDIPVMDLGRGS